MLNADQTVTLFNRYIDPETKQERWSRTVFHGVSWTEECRSGFIERGGQTAQRGMQVTQAATVRIPVDVDAQGKTYVPSHLWNGCEKKSSWTLQAGDKIALGEATAEFQRISELDRLYGLHTVMGWADNRRGGLPHWKAVLQ